MSDDTLHNAAGEGDLDARTAAALAANEALVLLTLIQTQGIGARKAGTRALYTEQGLEGTVGGGLFEVNACKEAAKVLQTGQSRLFSYVGQDDTGRGKRLLLCEYLNPNLHDLFALAADIRAQGDEKASAAWLVDLSDETAPKRTLLLAEKPFDTSSLSSTIVFDPTALAEFRQKTGGKAQLLANEYGREHDVYYEPLLIPPVVLLCGAGHVAQATAHIAHLCGFQVDVADDREHLLSQERFPNARKLYHVPDFANLVEACSIGSQHYVLLMTHSHETDQKVLTQILSSSAFYIGMLAGSAKRKEIFSDLKAWGIPDTELAAVNAPVGLPIGADTPEQIAVAIVAELLAAKAGVLKQLKPLA